LSESKGGRMRMHMGSPKLQGIISQGWVGRLFLLLLMMLTEITEFGMKGDLSPLRSDPGKGGLWFIVIAASANALIQVSVKTFDSAPFRWFIFALSFLYTLIFVGHQTTHLMLGEGFDIHFVLDLVHHILGIWSTVAAYKWSRSARGG
jgi:hypothetical protein